MRNKIYLRKTEDLIEEVMVQVHKQLKGECCQDPKTLLIADLPSNREGVIQELEENLQYRLETVTFNFPFKTSQKIERLVYYRKKLDDKSELAYKSFIEDVKLEFFKKPDKPIETIILVGYLDLAIPLEEIANKLGIRFVIVTTHKEFANKLEESSNQVCCISKKFKCNIGNV